MTGTNVIYYLDSSAVVRWLYNEPRVWKNIESADKLYLSVLTRIETRRSFDRQRFAHDLDNETMAVLLRRFAAFSKTVNWIGISDAVIEQAEMSFPVLVKSLDAIHIATALLLQKKMLAPLSFVTHDKQQAVAAQALGLVVTG